MSVPSQKLEVDPLPGFHMHWFRESNVARARQAGYELVDAQEVYLNGHSIGAPRALGGNTDMGSNVSIVGGLDDGNRPERLVLMKIPEAWWQEDRQLLDKKNASIMEAIFLGESVGAVEGKTVPVGEHAYVGLQDGRKPLLQRGVRKSKILQGRR